MNKDTKGHLISVGQAIDDTLEAVIKEEEIALSEQTEDLKKSLISAYIEALREAKFLAICCIEDEMRRAESFSDSLNTILDDPDHKVILEALGSDYDEDGVPYWEKWEDDFNDKAKEEGN